MELLDKLNILADSAKYDVSCSSSGSSRKNNSGVGNAHLAGICHTWSAEGRCVSLLKVLFSNCCIYDCKYCINRASNDIPRASFTPSELCELTINFYRRNYIEGLFLSSAVHKNPNYTMELIIKTIKLLREEYKFYGYIHVKAIPGADSSLIRLAGFYADRMSVNIELPSERGLKILAPQKKSEDIIKPMQQINSGITESKDLIKVSQSTKHFVPAGQTTQMIIGATPDSDLKILSLSEKLYNSFSLKRVYYSAYVPINSDTNLPSVYSKPPLEREHRLYQADWLLRYYGFNVNELLDINNSNLSNELDPKCDWAIRNINVFPVEINSEDYRLLLRVPGIGVQSAQKIIKARRISSLTYEDLVKFRVVLKRAKYFITCKGKYYGEVDIDSNKIKDRLVIGEQAQNYKQISVYDLGCEL